MSKRSILAVLAACVALSTGIGFAFGAASQPDSATAAQDTKLLKKIKNQVTDVQNRIGTTGTSSLVSRLENIGNDTARIESDTSDIESDTGRIELDTGRIEGDTGHICFTLGTVC